MFVQNGNRYSGEGNKKCEPLRWTELIRVAQYAFMISLAASPGRLKGTYSSFVSGRPFGVPDASSPGA